jgi:hypothetical protein
MQTVHSSTGTQWPLLQSKTEKKFQSGLLAVSAEFIAPVAEIISLSTLDSSEGPCDVYPLPSENYDTSPFKKISATAYKLWSVQKDENIMGSLAELTFHVYFMDFERDENGTRVFPLRQADIRYESKRIQILAETGVVKQAVEEGGVTTGSPDQAIPSLSRALGILQQKNTWTAAEIFNFGRTYDEPSDGQLYPDATQFLSSLSSQRFTPNIIEYSATYSVFFEINFGVFFETE